MRKHLALLSVLLSPLLIPVASAAPNENVLSLAGTWSFRIDRKDIGRQEKWYEAELPDRIPLPGSMTQAGLGDDITVDTPWTGRVQDRSWFEDSKYAKYREPGHVKVPFWLTPVKYYVGPAWYSREVIIPSAWAGKRIVLSLERCHWQTQVWVDGKEAGTCDSLAVAHTYNLTKLLPPGTHRLTIRVDNTVRIDVGVDAHSVSDHTQTNWNGIVGDIELRATDPVRIEDIQVYPNAKARSVLVLVTVGNSNGTSVDGTITLQAASAWPDQKQVFKPKEVLFKSDETRTQVQIDYHLRGSRLWDEFSPSVYTLTATVASGEMRHSRSVDFGLRELGREGTQFTLNGRKTFIRGTLECCIFPLTGYPPTDVDSWMRIYKIARAHGLNQLRFHSWCPPEAAFVAADRMGFMNQIECCVWTRVGDDPKTDNWIKTESDRILKAYGNHPSFCFLVHGNEPSGDNQKRFLGDLVNYWKGKDARRLYSSSSGWPAIPENQYQVTPEPRVYRWGESLNCRLNKRPPETTTDYREFIGKYDVPVVSHEIGQWCVYPDFSEIAKYTGVTRAYNFEIFRDGLREAGMLDQAHDFLIASGKLQTLCYKEDIESALRTPGMGGCVLLDLHDFPGQGTALVGVLNPFWDSKGYVTPEEYHRFCCETVPLARLKKRIFTADETFHAELEIAHFGPAPIENAVIAWKLADDRGQTVASGTLPKRSIPIGNGTSLGEISASLSGVSAACKLVLTVAVKDTPYLNTWDVWVYSPKVETAVPAGVVLAQELNDETLAALQRGGKVLLVPRKGSVVGDARGRVPPGFTSIFWNTAWTRRQPPHTLGILCDPKHPALAGFPTEFHSNWQWWDLIAHSQIMILKDLPAELRPIVQVIDDWVTNRRLALAFEGRIGSGKLLVCGMDIVNDLDSRPVSRQMRHALLQYMQGEQFAPKHELAPAALKAMLSAVRYEVIKVDSEAGGNPGFDAVDGSAETIWHTPFGRAVTDYPHEIQLKLEKPTGVEGIRYLPRQDQGNGWISEYEIYLSQDGKDWGQPAAAGTFPKGKKEQQILLPAPVQAQYLRFAAKKGFDGQKYAAIAELSVIEEPAK